MNYYEAMKEVRSGSFRSVYLVYGDELFLQNEFCQHVRSALVQPETADFNFHTVDPAPDQITRAVSLARTQPFLSDRRLVVVRDCPVFRVSRKAASAEGEAQGEEAERTAVGEESLLAYLNHPSPFACLLLMAGTSVDSRKKVTKAAIAAGGTVECRPLKEDDAAAWTLSRAGSHGKRLGDAAASLLVEKLGTNLGLIDSELRKLAVYAGEGQEITLADVESAVGGMAEAEIYHLTEAVMLKQRTRALQMLERALRRVDHPLQLLVAIANRYRQMLLVKSLAARGTSLREGPGLARMKPFPYEKMAGHLRRVPRAEIAGAMEKLLQADLAIKSGCDPRVTLEALVVDLMGIA